MTIAEAWFTIGGWVLAVAVLVWHWREPIGRVLLGAPEPTRRWTDEWVLERRRRFEAAWAERRAEITVAELPKLLGNLPPLPDTEEGS